MLASSISACKCLLNRDEKVLSLEKPRGKNDECEMAEVVKFCAGTNYFNRNSTLFKFYCKLGILAKCALVQCLLAVVHPKKEL